MSAVRRRRALSVFPKLKVANFALLLSVRKTENRINEFHYVGFATFSETCPREKSRTQITNRRDFRLKILKYLSIAGVICHPLDSISLFSRVVSNTL